LIDAKELLNEINTDQTIQILQDLGHNDEPKKNKNGLLFRTTLCHNGENYNLQYFDDTKDFYCHSECKKKYSLFDLIMNNKGCNFVESLQYVAAFIGYVEDFNKVNKRESESWNFIQQFKKQRKIYDYKENPTYPESILNQFCLIPYKEWINEGLSYENQNLFQVGIDIIEEKIIVPHRKWDTGELCGVMGRTMIENWKELKIPKWIPMYDFNKNLNLFGYWQNRFDIGAVEELILMESEKSPIKGRSYGINNICSTSGKSIQPEQIKILIRIGKPVVIAYDKNVEPKQLKEEAEKLKYYLPVSVIDSSVCEELGEKDAPIDKGKELFWELYNARVRVS
jgi:DNA primase